MLGALLLAACSTPYQPMGAMGGYADVRAGANGAVLVTFEGNGYTSESEVTKMWFRRAAEVCGGDDRYEVLDTKGTSETQIGPTTSTTNMTMNGNQATATTTSTMDQTTRHKRRGLIRCVNGGEYDSNRKLAGH